VIHSRPLRILIVEDDLDMAIHLRHNLNREGFQGTVTENARAGLERLKIERIDVIVSDLNLAGGMRGDEFLRHVRQSHPHVAFVMLTGEKDVPTAVQAMQDGAEEYLLKPSSIDTIADAVVSAHRKSERRREQLKRSRLAEHGAFMGQFTTIRTLVNTLETKDIYTRDHSKKVALCTMIMARAMGMDRPRMRELRIGALLHDIGKIGVPLTILHKEGSLSQDEWEVIKKHTTDGAHIVAPLAKYLPEVQRIVRHEHERWDGKGYPDGIGELDIPLGSRLIMLADTYDAVCSNRSYRKAQAPEVVLEIVREGAGSQFDPSLVPVFESTYHLFPKPCLN
jgi:putative nucleotidyltransferase with HDIG domain